MIVLPQTMILGEKPDKSLAPIKTGAGTIFQPIN